MISEISFLLLLQLTSLSIEYPSLIQTYSFADGPKKCQFRFPVKITSNFQADFHMNCELHKGDPFCDDGYKSSFQIEEMDRDGNRSCIHLTDNDTSKAFDGYQFVDNGIVMIYNIPHPEDFPDHCDKTKQLSFKIEYKCNPKQDRLKKIAIFEGDQISCSPILFVDSKQVCQYLPDQGKISKFKVSSLNQSKTCKSARKTIQQHPVGWFVQIESVQGQCLLQDLHHIDKRCSDDYKAMITLEITPPNLKMRCIHLTDDNPYYFGDIQPLAQNNGFKNTFNPPNTSAFPQKCKDDVDFTIFYICNPNQLLLDKGGNFFNGNQLKCHSFWRIESKYFCENKSQEYLIQKGKHPAQIIRNISSLQGLAQQLESTQDLQLDEQLLQHQKSLINALYQLQSDQTDVPKYNKIWEYIDKYNWFFTTAMVILGVFYVIFGLKMFKVTIFLFAMVTIVAFFLLVSFGFIISDGAGRWVGWIILGIGVLIGALAGYCLLKCVRIGIFLLGAWPGAVCGLLLYNLFLHYIAGNILLWIVVGALFIAGGIVALCLEDHAIIIGTSVLGSYFIVRGISLVAGEYPNQFIVYDEIQNGTESSFSWQFILYLVAMIGIAVFGIIFQEIKLRDQDDNEKEQRLKTYKRI